MKLIESTKELDVGEDENFGVTWRLGYDCVNSDEFLWETTKITSDRVHGRFCYLDMGSEWSDVGDYLYMCNGFLCRGSGAEPLWILKDYEKYIDIRYHKDYRRSMTYEKNGEKKLRWA